MSITAAEIKIEFRSKPHLLKSPTGKFSRSIHSLAIVVGSPGRGVDVDVLGVEGQGLGLNCIRDLGENVLDFDFFHKRSSRHTKRHPKQHTRMLMLIISKNASNSIEQCGLKTMKIIRMMIICTKTCPSSIRMPPI